MQKDPRSQNEDHTHLKSSLNSTHVTCNTKSNLSPELLFLITCAQTNPTEEDKAFIANYSSLITHHSSLITAATRHGILPLVYKTVKKLSQADSSCSFLNAERLTLNAFFANLKTAYTQIAQRNMMMSAELLKIMQLLEKNQIER